VDPSKPFLLKCDICDFRRWSDLGDDIKDLVSVNGCKNCGGPRKYKCPGCGYIVKARRYQPPPADPSKHVFGSGQ
jgi:hypothetical protein